MSTRLNKIMRDTLVKRIVDDVRNANTPALHRREHALATKMTIERYGSDVFVRCRSLPEGWLKPEKVLKLNYNLWTEQLPHFNYKAGTWRNIPQYKRVPSQNLELPEYVPLPMSFSGGWGRDEIGACWDELVEYFQDWVNLYTELEHLEKQTFAVVFSFSTVEKLATEWPTGYAHFPIELLAPGGPSNLPTVRIEDLDQRIKTLKHAA